MKINLIGFRNRNNIVVSLPKKFHNFFPDYFILEIETRSVHSREKGFNPFPRGRVSRNKLRRKKRK